MLKKKILFLLLLLSCVGLIYIVLPSGLFGNYYTIRKLGGTTNRVPHKYEWTIRNVSNKVNSASQDMTSVSLRESETVISSQTTHSSFDSPSRGEEGFQDAEKLNQTILSENKKKNEKKNNSSGAKMSKLLGEQMRRRKIMNKVCESYNISETFTPDVDFTFRMLVNERFKFVFTYIPKVGCTTWKAVFRHKGFLRPIKDTDGLNRLSLYTDKDRENILRNYKKVMFIREPLVRLLSAYLSKFRGRGHIRHVWDSTFGKNIKRMYRNNSRSAMARGASQSKAPTIDIRLDEFVQYILELTNATEMTGLTDHWLPQSIVSHVCHVRYDFIGKYEYLETEAPFLLQWLGTSYKFPKYHPSKTESLLKSEYSEVSRELILKIPEYYRRDYEIFDYEPTETLTKILT